MSPSSYIRAPEACCKLLWQRIQEAPGDCSPTTHPPRQKVKAEFVLTGAQVNDALKTKCRGRVNMTKECQQTAWGTHRQQSGHQSTLPPPSLSFLIGLQNPICHFQHCLNTTSSKKPSPKPHWEGLFESWSPTRLFPPLPCP